ncbi:MAG: hypothetical protein ABIH42_02990 [Planctomycetota bacterium]
MKTGAGLQKLLVIISVLCITSVCVIVVVSAGSTYKPTNTQSIYRELPNQNVHDKTQPDKDIIPTDDTPVKPPRKTKPVKPSSPSTPPVENANQQPINPVSAQDENNAAAAIFLGEHQRYMLTAQPVEPPSDESGQAEIKPDVQQMLEFEARRARGEMLRQVNNVSRKLNLERSQREDIAKILEQTLTDITAIKSQFITMQMTESDEDLMRSQIKELYSAAGEKVRYILGDEKYKEFRKEYSSYNKNEQMNDKIEDVNRQNEKLRRELEQQKRDSTRPHTRGKFRPNSAYPGSR